jgi:hypothetical protein
MALSLPWHVNPSNGQWHFRSGAFCGWLLHQGVSLVIKVSGLDL